MLFNSIDFAVFLPIFFVLYWFGTQNNLKRQNFLIVIASYIFYGWWDWRFLFLILLSTLTDYFVGLGLKQDVNIKRRKALLWLSILVNLGFLGFFKYFNFFIDNFIEAFSFFGYSLKLGSLELILPVGISFYTFQTLSYTIDVYKRKLEPTSDFIAFAAYVSFFPQLVAGPIERAKQFLPQFFKKRKFDSQQAVDGLRQMLWGLFKKVVIADNCAYFVDIIFNNQYQYSGSTLLLGVFLFAFQIYGDFSGYSDIAIGTSKLFGFNLMRNFAYPYFSRDIAEFWRRWHISLSTWFRDYLYIPLGGSRGGTWMKVQNTFIIFIVSGFWHGANWTFIIWGLLNAVYFLPLLVLNSNRNNIEIVAKNSILPSFRDFLSIIGTFLLTLLAWVFFRSGTVTEAMQYIGGIFSFSLFSIPEVFPPTVIMLIFSLIVIEWIQRREQHALAFSETNSSVVFRWSSYLVISFFCVAFLGKENTFIYFQF